MAIRVRSNNPNTLWVDHKKYKPFLRLDFEHACAYCDFTEPQRGGSRAFHVDHYKPQKKCRTVKERNAYTNLIYACGICNEWKKVYWPNKLLILLQQFILDPCKIDPDIHIDKTAPRWQAKSPLGHFNIEKLHLSSKPNIDDRRAREDALTTISDLEQLGRELLARDPLGSDTLKTVARYNRQIQSLRGMIMGPKD